MWVFFGMFAWLTSVSANQLLSRFTSAQLTCPLSFFLSFFLTISVTLTTGRTSMESKVEPLVWGWHQGRDLKRREVGGRHYNALLFESRVRLRERFSFETCEIKSFSLPMPPRDSAEMIRFMCHSVICSLKAFSLRMQLYRMDVNENVGHCDVGPATAGALNLVSLIDHTCLGSVCIFIH